MIRLTYEKKLKVLTVAGNDVERMLFVSAWQSALWPQWLERINEQSSSMDPLRKQWQQTLYSLRLGRPVLLACSLGPLREAVGLAVDRCRAIGIVFELEGLRVPVAGAMVVEPETPETDDEFGEGLGGG